MNRDTIIARTVKMVRELYSKTSEDGILYVDEKYYEYDPYNEHNATLKCKLNWTADDCKAATSHLAVEACALAAAGKRAHANNLTMKDIEENEQFKNIWDRFIAPFDCTVSDELRIKIENLEANILPEELQEEYDDYQQTFKQECIRRVGDGLNAYKYVDRGRRLYTLFKMDALDEVIRNELKGFTLSYILFKYGISIKRIDESVADNKTCEPASPDLAPASTNEDQAAANKHKSVLLTNRNKRGRR